MTIQLISQRLLSANNAHALRSCGILQKMSNFSIQQPYPMAMGVNSSLNKQILFSSPSVPFGGPTSVLLLHTTAVVERARQSTRIRKRKIAVENKKKKEERLRKNPPPLPKKVVLMLKSKGLSGEPQPWRQPDDKDFPTDDVWFENWHTYRRSSLSEALDCLREHYHPTMLDDPEGMLWAKVEFNMAGAKKGRYLEAFSKMVPIYHPFERGVEEKSIMVFAHSPDVHKEAEAAGAKKAGGLDLIEDIVKGKVEVIDFDHFLAHEDISLELKPLLGILREKFPKKQLGTIGTDIARLVKTYSNGQLIQVKKPKPTLGYIEDPSYGYCEAQVGRLNMQDDEILGNITTLLEFLREKAPSKSSQFVTRCDLYMEGLLRRKFPIVHDLVDDAKYKKYIQSSNARSAA